MALIDMTLAELARARVGAGVVLGEQTGSPFSAANAAPTSSGDGVDVSSAALATVRVRADTGDPTFTVYARTEGRADEWEACNGLISKNTGSKSKWKEVVFVGMDAELYVHVENMGGASSVSVLIEHANGGAGA